MQRGDFGDIVNNYRYVRELYSADKKERGEYLLSSNNLFSKLTNIYDRVGIRPIEEDKRGVRVKLPNSTNPIFRKWWHETAIKRTEESTLIIRVDELAGYIEGEAVLATSIWMREFEAAPGDKIIISPCVPIPEFGYSFR